jgi:hypothetical protein
MKKICFFAILAFGFFNIHAQTVILEREEDGVMDTSFTTIFEEEADKKWMTPVFFDFSFPLLQSEEGAEIRNLLSGTTGFGFMPMYKCNKYFAAGFDIAYYYTTYELQQDSGKIVPSPYYENERESFRFYTLQAGPALHITYQPSEYKLGKFINITGDAVWLAGRHHYTSNENEDGSITEVLTRKLQYTHPFYLTAQVRFGFGAFSVFGNYRFTDIFKTEYAYPELARLFIGVSLLVN